MSQSRTETLTLMLMAIVILLMVAIGGLFFRMTQLQRRVLLALSAAQAAPPPDMGLATDTPATDFDLVATDGRTVSLSDWAGQPVVLIFSSTGCPACKQMYPYLKAFSESHPKIQTVVVSRGTAEENLRLVEENGFQFPVLGWDGTVAEQYQVPGTPFAYIIDSTGTIVHRGLASSAEELERLVSSLDE